MKLDLSFLTEIKTKNDIFKSHFSLFFTSWKNWNFCIFEIFTLKFFWNSDAMVPRWCSRDDPNSNFPKFLIQQQFFASRMKFMKSQDAVLGPWISILLIFLVFSRIQILLIWNSESLLATRFVFPPMGGDWWRSREKNFQPMRIEKIEEN